MQTGKSYKDRLDKLNDSIAQKAFRFVYQPIFDAQTRDILGYEALCRPEDPVFSGPSDLFEAAEQADRIESLGRVLRELAVAPISGLAESYTLFLNIHPGEFYDPELGKPEAFMQPWLSRVVLEIDPGGRDDPDRLRDRMGDLRKLGFRLALDGLAEGYLGLDQLIRLRPDFLKLPVNRLLLGETERWTARANQHLMETARGEGIPVIVCRIESEGQMQYALKLVCDHLQGRHLGNEAPPFAESSQRLAVPDSTTVKVWVVTSTERGWRPPSMALS